MCMSGGGNKAAAEARAREERQAAERRAAMAEINALFDAPATQQAYAQHGADVYALNRAELDKAQADRARERSFQLARQGLSGGSQDAFTAGESSEQYLKALAGIQRHASEAEQGLRSSDERARANLVGQATAGLDPAQASQLAYSAIGSNLGAARTQNNYADLGQFMQALSLGQAATDESSARAAARRAYQDDPWRALRLPNSSGGTQTAIG